MCACLLWEKSYMVSLFETKPFFLSSLYHIVSSESALPPVTPRPKFVSYETQLNRFPALTTCPSCQTQVTTHVTYRVGTFAWLVCLVFVFCGWGESYQNHLMLLIHFWANAKWHTSKEWTGKQWCWIFVLQIAAGMLPDSILCELL